MKVIVIPVVIGALGTIPRELVKGVEDLDIRGQGDYSIQTTVLLRLARILSKVLKTLGDLLSSANTNVKKSKE